MKALRADSVLGVPRADPTWKRRAQYMTRYGITLEQYNEMLNRQEGVCAICKKPPKVQSLHVDHDHKTGVIRGLLCYPCNKTLSWVENTEWLDSAQTYLKQGR